MGRARVRGRDRRVRRRRAARRRATTATRARTRSRTSPRRSAASSCRRSARSGSARSCRSTGVAAGRATRSIHGRLHPLGPGQGLDDRPLGADGRRRARRRCRPTREGFPPELVARAASGDRAARCSATAPYNGHRGDRGLRRASTCARGALILYTSQDSVLQIAAHVERRAAGGAVRACARRARR